MASGFIERRTGKPAGFGRSTSPGLGALLEQFGLTRARREPLPHHGLSGAKIFRLIRNSGESFVLKRTSLAHDWIMRATADAAGREAIFAGATTFGSELSPTLGTARDGAVLSILMRDISDFLLGEGPLGSEHLAIIVSAMAELHEREARFAGELPWCPLEKRVLLLTPKSAEIARSMGAGKIAGDIIAGWDLFRRLAPTWAVRLVDDLQADLTPFERALSGLPPLLLHGDLKLDNIGIEPCGRVWLIDWAMSLVAPSAVELGWFMAVNSRRLPVSLDELLDLYARRVGLDPGLRARHDALAALCGLLLRGWRKALDASQGDGAELKWWCERACVAQRWL
jgi:hypothetical protein